MGSAIAAAAAQVPVTLLLSRADDHALSPVAKNSTPEKALSGTASKHSTVQQQQWRAARALLLYSGFFLACLLLLSEFQLSQYTEHYKTSPLQLILPSHKASPTRPAGTAAPVHWTRHVYHYMFWVSLPQFLTCLSSEQNLLCSFPLDSS